jgi:hypothetical protein
MRFAALLLAAGLLGAASPSPAPTDTPSIALAQSRVDTMLRTGHADPAWFSQSFLDQIPASRVDEVIASVVKQLGAYQSVELKSDKFVAHFAALRACRSCRSIRASRIPASFAALPTKAARDPAP